MSRIYTFSLWTDSAPTAGAYTAVVGAAGETVVLTSIDVWSIGQPGQACDGFEMSNDTIVWVWGAFPPDTMRNKTQQWRGRMACPGGSHLTMVSFDTNYYWNVTGYRLAP